MKVLCFGLDGADYDLVRQLLAEGKLPTIARLSREGSFGPLRSTIPAVTPTAWSSFITGLNPGRHGIFNFSSNPNRDRQRVESALSRSGTPIWRALSAAGIPSAYITLPFTYPAEPIDGIVVTGYGGPARPEILPEAAAQRILEAYPDLVTAHHPLAERWWEDFEGYTQKLLRHVDELAGVCRLVLDLEPKLGLLCVDFMSADHAGHLGWNRLDPEHPAHDPTQTGDEIVQVYEAIDRVCGQLIAEAGERWDEEPTAIVLSDHGMKPIYWNFHANRWLEEAGYLRYRRRSLQALKKTRLDVLSKVDQKLARTRRHYARAFDRLPASRPTVDRAFADIDFGSTKAYCFATGGQIFLGEASGARTDAKLLEELHDALSSIAHPETGESAFEVKRKEELYEGPFAEKAPELVLLPRDERIHVDSSRRAWDAAFERHEHLDPESFYGYSGHHGMTGILGAAGPGIRMAEVPSGAEIEQMAATLLALCGLSAELDGAPIEAILDDSLTCEAAVLADGSAPALEPSAYSEEEEAEIVERLRDLGYE